MKMADDRKTCKGMKKPGIVLRHNILVQEAKRTIEKLLRGTLPTTICGEDEFRPQISHPDNMTTKKHSNRGSLTDEDDGDTKQEQESLMSEADAMESDTVISTCVPSGSPSIDDMQSLLDLWGQVKGVFDEQEEEFLGLLLEKKHAQGREEARTRGKEPRLDRAREQRLIKRVEMLKNFKNKLLTTLCEMRECLAKKEDFIRHLEEKNRKLKLGIQARSRHEHVSVTLWEEDESSVTTKARILPCKEAEVSPLPLEKNLLLCRELFGGLSVHGDLIREIFNILLEDMPHDRKTRKLEKLFRLTLENTKTQEKSTEKQKSVTEKEEKIDVRYILQEVDAEVSRMRSMCAKNLEFVWEMEQIVKNLVKYSNILHKEYDTRLKSLTAVSVASIPEQYQDNPKEDKSGLLAPTKETTSQRCTVILSKQQALRDKLQDLGDFVRKELTSDMFHS